jgi:hypothetical protein
MRAARLMAYQIRQYAATMSAAARASTAKAT